MDLILASASPRRQTLLRDAGYAFRVEPAQVDEDGPLAEGRYPPAELALFLARAKAEAVAALFPQDLTLAADTVVAVGGQSIGKPEDPSTAREMLRRLAGTTHAVITGLAFYRPAGAVARTVVVTSEVRMKPLRGDPLQRYLDSGLWKGKAGGYGIQDPGAPVELVSGSLTNVIGLPMDEVRQVLAELGVEPQRPPR